MSEPIERLSQFTPHAGKLDRDALLFAAGRASALPNRGWQVITATLAGIQLLTLAILLPRPATVQETNIAQSLPLDSTTPDVPLPASSHIWSIHQNLKDVPLDERFGDSLVLIDTEPDLHAFGRLLPAAVN